MVTVTCVVDIPSSHVPNFSLHDGHLVSKSKAGIIFDLMIMR